MCTILSLGNISGEAFMFVSVLHILTAKYIQLMVAYRVILRLGLII
jgi:hypothetical protein